MSKVKCQAKDPSKCRYHGSSEPLTVEGYLQGREQQAKARESVTEAQVKESFDRLSSELSELRANPSGKRREAYNKAREAHGKMRLLIIDGEQCSPQGIPIQMGTRCSHGVVDGDKPLTVKGPRCLTCREDWYPLFVESPHGAAHNKHVCKECGQDLHTTSIFNHTTERYLPSFWSHNSPTGCRRSTYAIRGAEERYSLFGEKGWSEYVDGLIRRFNDDLEYAQVRKERSKI